MARRCILLCAAAHVSLAWAVALESPAILHVAAVAPAVRRAPTPVADWRERAGIASDEAKEAAAQTLAAKGLGKSTKVVPAPPSAAPKRQEEVDLQDAAQTFEFLCRSSGVPPADGAEMDYDGFQLAFEQLFTTFWNL